MQKYSDVVLQAPGAQPIVGASVQVNTFPGGAPATIYSDNGVTPQANPILSDGNGRYSFYAADGRYALVISKAQFTTQTITDVLLQDPEESSALDPGATAAANTTAMNAQIAAFDAVYVAPGTYNLNALASTRLRNLLLSGEGRVSKLAFNTTGKGFTAGPFTAGDQKYTLVIRDLAFTNVTNVPAAFISQEFYVNTVLEKLYFSIVSATYCIDQVSGYGTTIKDCVFSDVTGTAIRLRDNGAAPNYSYVAGVENCDVTRCTGNGIEVETANVLKVTKTVIEGCVNGIITSTNGSGVSAQLELSSVYFESNSTAHIDLGTNGGSYWGRALCIACWFNGGTIKLGSKSKITFIGIQGAGAGAPVTITGSGNAEAVFIGCQMASFVQSGTFAWTVIGGTEQQTFTPGSLVVQSMSRVAQVVDHQIQNTDNTSGGSDARLFIDVGGDSAGDPTVQWHIAGVTGAVAGIDNSDSNKWKLSLNTSVLGTNDALVAAGAALNSL